LLARQDVVPRLGQPGRLGEQPRLKAVYRCSPQKQSREWLRVDDIPERLGPDRIRWYPIVSVTEAAGCYRHCVPNLWMSH
jgi:hypothetical protein